MGTRRRLALVHDHLVQRGGAERVVLSLAQCFSDVPVHTSFYSSELTYPGFRDIDVRTLKINKIKPLRTRHRMALPLLAPAFGRQFFDVDVTLCSSAGWAHGVRTSGRKIVYCYAPARWLYTPEASLGSASGVTRLAAKALHRSLHRWDQAAMADADVIIAISSAVRQRIADAYQREAEVVFPPLTFDPLGEKRSVRGLDPGFFLLVSRLIPYKNVRSVVEAFTAFPEKRLVVVGTGPERDPLVKLAGMNVRFVGAASDDELRWLYGSCAAVIAASFEDFGLTPLEGAAFGKPAIVLRWGGFLDTILEGETGLFFDAPRPSSIRDAVEEFADLKWDAELIRGHSQAFSEDRFLDQIRAVVMR